MLDDDDVAHQIVSLLQREQYPALQSLWTCSKPIGHLTGASSQPSISAQLSNVASGLEASAARTPATKSANGSGMRLVSEVCINSLDGDGTAGGPALAKALIW
jgi:hypothetical protein